MIADIVFLAALLVVCVIGDVKSFTGIVRGVLFLVCLFAGTALLTSPLTRLLELTGLGNLMAETFAGNFAEKGGGMLVHIGGSKAELSQGLQGAGVPALLASPCAALIAQLLPSASGTVAMLLGRLIARLILSLIASIILLITIAIVFKIIKKLLLRSHESYGFRRVDGILGIVMMVVILLCVTWLALGIVEAKAASDFGVKSIRTLNKNYVLRFLFLNNPLSALAAGIFG